MTGRKWPGVGGEMAGGGEKWPGECPGGGG